MLSELTNKRSFNISGLLNRLLSYIISFTLILQQMGVSAYASSSVSTSAGDITIDGGTNTSLDRAQNDVPILNIAPASSNGVSRNTFDSYNVGSKGLVINNSTSVGVSDLGGAIYANPNFVSGGSAATAIINEVTSSNISRLQGYSEIFGGAADLYIINPNGISCNGCGFINTPKVMLGTGKSVMSSDGSELLGLNISDSAKIVIEGLGLDAETVDYFDIISRAVEINADIYAQDLSIRTGNKYYDIATKEITSDASNPSTKPTISIDSSALGGMYSGRITLESNESGVGVNIDGDLLATSNNLAVDSSGNIVLASELYGKDGVSVTSSNGDITISSSSTITSDAGVTIGSVNVTNDGVITGGSDVTITTEEDLTNNNEITSSGSLTITSTGDLHNDSKVITSTGDMQITAKNLHNSNNAKILTDSNLTITASESIINTENYTGTGDREYGLLSGNALNIYGPNISLYNNNSNIISNGTLTISPTVLPLTTESSSSTSSTPNVQPGQGIALIQNEEGYISSSKDSTLGTSYIYANSILNQSGNLVSNNDLILTGQGSSFFNNIGGHIESKQSLTINLDNYAETGSEVTEGLNNQGGVLKSGGNFIGSNIDNSGGGLIESGGDIVLSSIDNIIRNDGGTLNGIGIDSTISLLELSNLENDSGEIRSAGNIDIGFTGDYETEGKIQSDISLIVRGNKLTNSGDLQSRGSMLLEAREGNDFINSLGVEILADGSIDIISGSLDNSGKIHSGSVLTLDIGSSGGTGRIDNGSGSEIKSTTSSIITAEHIENGGKLNSNGRQIITASSITNSGQLAGGLKQNITLSGDMSNSLNSIIYGGTEGLYIDISGKLSNDSGYIQSGGILDISSDSGITNDNVGRLISTGDMVLSSLGGIYNKSSIIESGKTLTITGDSFSNERTSGDVVLYSLYRDDLITKDSPPGYYVFYGWDGGLELWKGDFQDSYRTRIPHMNSPGVGITRKEYLAYKNPLILTSTLSSKGDMVIDTVGDIVNDLGVISSGGDMTLTGRNLINYNYGLNDRIDYECESTACYGWGWNGTSVLSHVAEFSLSRDEHFIFYRSGDLVSGYIKAGKSLKGDFRNRIDNDLILEGNGPVSLGQNMQSVDLSLLPTDILDIDSVEGIDLLEYFTIPDLGDEDGLFRRNDPISEPDIPWIEIKPWIETNLDYIDIGKFYGGSWFLDRIGFDPEDASIRLMGDGYVESILLEDALQSTIGKKTLVDGQSTAELMKELYDNAYGLLEEYKKHGLEISPGISLSGEIIANLTRDVIWLEEQIIDGQKVLVPKVYLSKATKDRLAKERGGSGIASGGDMLLAATDEISSEGGNISSGGDLNITSSEGSVTLEDTELESDGKTKIAAKTKVAIKSNNLDTDNSNQESSILTVKDDAATARSNSVFNSGTDIEISSSGDIDISTDYMQAGGSIFVTSSGGDISNSSHTLNAGDDVVMSANNIYNRADAAAVSNGGSVPSIIATNMVSLDATSGDIVNEGGNIEAGTYAYLTASNDIINKSLIKHTDTVTGEVTTGHQSASTDLNVSDYQTEELLSEGSISGQDVVMVAGNDITNEGSNISSTGETYLEAGNNVNITSSKVENKSATAIHKGVQKDHTIINTGSDINVGTNLTIISGNDTKVSGSNITTGGNIDISAGGSFTEESVEDYSKTEKKWKSGKRGRTKHHRYVKETITQQGSLIQSTGGNIVIDSGSNIEISSSDLSASGDVNMKSKDDINIISKGDYSAEHYNASRGGLFGGHDYGNSTVRRTQRSSSTSSGVNYVSESGANTTIVASTIESGGNLNLTSGRHDDGMGNVTINQDANINIISGIDVSQTSSSESNISLTSGISEVSSDRTESTQVSSNIRSGGSLGILSSGDTKIEASNVESGGDAVIMTGGYYDNGNNLQRDGSGKLEISSAKNVVYEESRTRNGAVEFDLEEAIVGYAGGHALTTGEQVSLGPAGAILAGIEAELTAETVRSYSEETVSSTIKSGGNLTLDSESNVLISGSDVSSSGNVSITSNNADVLITASAERNWNDRELVRTEIDLSIDEDFNIELGSNNIRSSVVEEIDYHKSNITSSGGKVTISGNNSGVLGSDVSGSSGVDITARAGDVLISSLQSSSYKKDNNVEMVSSISAESTSSELSVTAGIDFSQDRSSNLSNNLVTSSITGVNGSVSMNSTGDINLASSHVVSNTDVLLTAGNNVNIAGETVDNVSKESSLEVSAGLRFGIDHNIGDFASHLEDLEGLNLLDVLETVGSLPELVSNISNGAGVDGFLSGNEEGINDGFNIFNTYQKYKAGPNGSAALSVRGTLNISSTDSSSSDRLGSAITAGNDVNIVSSNEDINIEGSTVTALNDVVLNSGRDLNIISGESSSSNSSNSYGGEFDIDIVGTSGAGATDISINGSHSHQKRITHTNSNITAGNNLSTISSNDTKILGGNLSGDIVNMTVGNDLELSSRQDISEGENDSLGLSVGYGGARDTSGGFNISSGYNKKHWVSDQSSIIGSNSVNINTSGNTDINGGLIANIDGNGVDGGNLSIVTNTLSYRDIKDVDKARQFGLGINVGPSADSSNNENELSGINVSYSMHDREQMTRATIGRTEFGSLIIGGESVSSDSAVISGLNRDIAKSQDLTKNLEVSPISVEWTNVSKDADGDAKKWLRADKALTKAASDLANLSGLEGVSAQIYRVEDRVLDPILDPVSDGIIRGGEKIKDGGLDLYNNTGYELSGLLSRDDKKKSIIQSKQDGYNRLRNSAEVDYSPSVAKDVMSIVSSQIDEISNREQEFIRDSSDPSSEYYGQGPWPLLIPAAAVAISGTSNYLEHNEAIKDWDNLSVEERSAIIRDVVIDTSLAATGGGGSGLLVRSAVKKAAAKRGNSNMSNHAIERQLQRRISDKAIKNSLSKGIKYYDPKNNSIVYVHRGRNGRYTSVATTPEGKIKTVMDSAKRSKLIRKRFKRID